MDLTERLDRFTENTQVRYIAAGLLIVVGLVLIAGAEIGQEKRLEPGNHSISDDGLLNALEVNLTLNYGDSVDSDVIPVVNGSTVFQALNRTQNVSYRESEYGYFITSINNVSGSSEQYWTYKVNNESAEVGAGQYSLTESSNVTFTLSE